MPRPQRAGGAGLSDIRALIFDWGNTVMRVFPEYSGPMAHWPRVEAVPGVEEALRTASERYLVVLASNAADSGPNLVRDALERVGLEKYFREVATARDLGAAKPEPEFFRAILRRIGCKPSEAVMVGDHFDTDIAGAKRAGLWTVWFNPSGKGAPAGGESRADATIRDLRELENALMVIKGRAQRARE